MSAVYEWLERGDSLQIRQELGGGLRVTVDNDGETASIVLSDRAASALANAVADQFELNHCSCEDHG